MASVEIDDEEIVDAVIANPEIIVRALNRLKENGDSLRAFGERQQEVALRCAEAAERAKRNANYTPLKCSLCGGDSIALWEGDLCAGCSASAIEASGQDGETRLDAKHESVGPKDDAHD